MAYKTDGSVDEGHNFFYDYQYDNTGNIIKKTKYKMKDGKRVPVEVVESAIVYYSN